jgi:hypothetical protein
MSTPSPINAADRVYNAQLANITAATVTYIPIANPGRVKRFGMVPTVVTATGSATAQLAYAPPGSSTYTNIASGLLTIPSGNAAGLTVMTDLTPSSDAYVQDGGTLRITMGGTATGGGTPMSTLTIGV